MTNVYDAKDVVLTFNGETLEGFSSEGSIIINRSEVSVSRDIAGTSIKDIPKEIKARSAADI
jgi:hypothetical protein